MENYVGENQEERCLFTKNVSKFLKIFSQENRRAAREKARVWYNNRNYWYEALQIPRNRLLTMCTYKTTVIIVKRVQLKILSGSDRKRAPWKNVLHTRLFEEFCRLWTIAFEFIQEYLRYVCLRMIHELRAPISATKIEEETGKSASDLISQ